LPFTTANPNLDANDYKEKYPSCKFGNDSMGLAISCSVFLAKFRGLAKLFFVKIVLKIYFLVV